MTSSTNFRVTAIGLPGLSPNARLKSLACLFVALVATSVTAPALRGDGTTGRQVQFDIKLMAFTPADVTKTGFPQGLDVDELTDDKLERLIDRLKKAGNIKHLASPALVTTIGRSVSFKSVDTPGYALKLTPRSHRGTGLLLDVEMQSRYQRRVPSPDPALEANDAKATAEQQLSLGYTFGKTIVLFNPLGDLRRHKYHKQLLLTIQATWAASPSLPRATALSHRESPSDGGEGIPWARLQRPILQLKVGDTQRVKLPNKVESIRVRDESLIDVSPQTPTVFRVTGRVAGATEAIILTDEGMVRTMTVLVLPKADSVTETLKKLFPGSDVHVETQSRGNVLMGRVKSARQGEEIHRLAQKLQPGVINEIEVRELKPAKRELLDPSKSSLVRRGSREQRAALRKDVRNLRSEVDALRDDVRKVIEMLQSQTRKAKHPDQASSLPDSSDSNESTGDAPGWRRLGLRLGESLGDVGGRYRGGLKIAAVRPDGPAHRAGIRPNDILVGLDRWETISLKNFDFALKRANRERQLKVYVLRNGETMFTHVELAAPTEDTDEDTGEGKALIRPIPGGESRRAFVTPISVETATAIALKNNPLVREDARPAAEDRSRIAVIPKKLSANGSLSDFEQRVRGLVAEVETAYRELSDRKRRLHAERDELSRRIREWREAQGDPSTPSEQEASQRTAYFEARAKVERATSSFYESETKLRKLLGVPATDGRLLTPVDAPQD